MVKLVEIPEEKDVEEGYLESELESASVRTATSIDSTISPSETSEDESGQSEVEQTLHDDDVIMYPRRMPKSAINKV
jgi:hypothetical protein